MAAKIKKRLSLRKFVIAMLGTYTLLRGIAYLPFSNIPPDLPSGLDKISTIIPIEFWAGIWIFIAVNCFIRTFTEEEGIAIPLVVGMMLLWGFSYGYGWATDFLNGEYTRFWITASTYIFPAIVIGILSANGGENIELDRLTKDAE